MNTKPNTMVLARKVAPAVLEAMRDLSADPRNIPVPFVRLGIHEPLRKAINKVREDAHCDWPYPEYLLGKALQYLRKKGDVRSTTKGWTIPGNVTEPAVTLTTEEYRMLKELLDEGDHGHTHKVLIRKVLRAVRYQRRTGT